MISLEYPDLLTNIVASLLIIAFGIVIGNILSILTKKLLESFEVENLLKKINIQFPVEEFVSLSVRYLFYLGALFLGLNFLGLGETVLIGVLILLLVLLILFVLAAIKDSIPNFYAGLLIYFKKKIRKNEIIRFEQAEGKVTKITLLDTRLKMKDGDIVIVPNTLILKSKIVKKRR